MNTNKILLSILASLSIGAIAGVLYAPKKGCKTRKNILNKGKSISDSIKNSITQIEDEVEKKYDETLHKAEEIFSPKKKV